MADDVTTPANPPPPESGGWSAPPSSASPPPPPPVDASGAVPGHRPRPGPGSRSTTRSVWGSAWWPSPGWCSVCSWVHPGQPVGQAVGHDGLDVGRAGDRRRGGVAAAGARRPGQPAETWPGRSPRSAPACSCSGGCCSCCPTSSSTPASSPRSVCWPRSAPCGSAGTLTRRPSRAPMTGPRPGRGRSSSGSPPALTRAEPGPAVEPPAARLPAERPRAPRRAAIALGFAAGQLGHPHRIGRESCSTLATVLARGRSRCCALRGIASVGAHHRARRDRRQRARPPSACPPAAGPLSVRARPPTPTRARGSAAALNEPSGSTTIAWAWPNAPSKAGATATSWPRAVRSAHASVGDAVLERPPSAAAAAVHVSKPVAGPRSTQRGAATASAAPAPWCEQAGGELGDDLGLGVAAHRARARRRARRRGRPAPAPACAAAAARRQLGRVAGVRGRSRGPGCAG